MSTTGIKETQDLVEFSKVLTVQALSNPNLIKAIKTKAWGEVGGILAGVAMNPDFRNAATAAIDGIGSIPAEIKDVDVFEGITLGRDLLAAASAAAEAYKAGQQ